METTEAKDTRRATVFDIRVFCVGTNPLLMNQYEREKMVNDLIFKEKKVPDTETPLRERADKIVFRDKDKRIVLPTEQILACLCAGGSTVPLRGRTNLSRAGGKYSMVPNFLEITGGEYIPLLLPDGTPVNEESWEVDVRRGILKDSGGGTTCAIVRPKFPQWAFLLNCRVDLSKVTGLTLLTVRKLFETAGSSHGIGGYTKIFGRFAIADGGWLVTAVDTSTIARPKAPEALMQVPDGVTRVEAS